MTLAEATEGLMNEILVSFADMDDDEMIPLRDFMRDVGVLCGVENERDLLQVPPWASVGWLRANIRKGIFELSSIPNIEEVLERDFGS